MIRRTVRVQVADALIDTLAAGSLVGASLLAPNAVQLVGKVYLRHMDKRNRERELRYVIHYLHRQALIDIKEDGDQYEIAITDKGTVRHTRFQFENMHIPPMERWDGRWRIVMFDVPEKQGAGRRALAAKLSETGFRPLQKSAWVHPFDCREQVELIKYVYPEIAPYVVFLETDTIDNHNTLVRHFRTVLSRSS